MTWPTPISTADAVVTNTDAGTDAPASARDDIKLAMELINEEKVKINGILANGAPLTASDADITQAANKIAQRDVYGLLPESAGRLIGVQKFTASGTYTPTAGTKLWVIEVQGAGSSGFWAAQGGAGISVGCGGRSGAYCKAKLTSIGGSSLAITVGAKGTYNAGSGIFTPGGNSSFGGIVIADGGASPAGGNTTSATYPFFAVDTSATDGVVSGTFASTTVLSSRNNLLGSAGIVVAGAYPMSGDGAPSMFGNGGRGLKYNQGSGVAAAIDAYGAGGGGALTYTAGASLSGGDGAPGVVIIYEYS